MGNSALGLVIGLGVDTAEGRAQLDAFGQSIGNLTSHQKQVAAAFGDIESDAVSAEEAAALFSSQSAAGLGRVANAVGPVRKNMMDAEENARLFGEMLGIHLPRTVTRFVGEMAPAIAGISASLIGAFAVERVIEWGAEAIKEFHALRGETDALNEHMKVILDEQKKLLTDFTSTISGGHFISETVADLDKVNTQIEVLQKQLAATPKKAADAVASAAGAWSTPLMAEAAASSAVAVQVSQQLNDLEKKRDELQDRLKQQEDRMRGLLDQAHKEAAQEAEKSAHQQEQAVQRVAQTERKMADWRIHTMQEAGKAIQQLRSQEEGELGTKARLDQEELNFAIHLGEYVGAQRGEIQNVQTIIPLFSAETTTVRHLSAAKKELLEITQLLHKADTDTEQAKQEAVRAQVESAESEIATFIGAIAGRKAQAEVEGAFYLAEGGFDLARGIWPPNPALIARGLGEIGAGINMLKVAGRSGGSYSTGGAGGGGGGYGADQHGGGYDESPYSRPPQTLAPGAAGAGGRFGGTLHVMVMGESQAGAWLAGTLNNAVNRGVRLTATSSQRGSPVGH